MKHNNQSGKRQLIGITGEKGKGKTTLVHVLNFLLSINGYNANVFNFADYIKQIARECFDVEIGNIHGKLSQEQRELLCKIGDALRSIDPNCLVKVIDRKIKQNQGFIIIGDVRLQREADMIKSQGGIIVRMQSHSFNRSENYLQEHVTEKEIAGIQPDFEIVNDGTFADLVHEAKKVLRHLSPHHDWKG